MSGERILVVDDDRALLRALTIGLTARGYDVETARTGSDGIVLTSLRQPGVVVLDLSLPDLDGAAVCARIREFSEVPILILSALGSEERKVDALDRGADDFVTKPFGMAELEARLRVLLRRSLVSSPSSPTQLHVGSLAVDLVHRTASVDGEALRLTSKEFDLVAFLARHEGKVCTHQMILRDVWGATYSTEAHYLRVYAHRLRRKAGCARRHARHAQRHWLRTRRGRRAFRFLECITRIEQARAVALPHSAPRDPDMASDHARWDIPATRGTRRAVPPSTTASSMIVGRSCGSIDVMAEVTSDRRRYARPTTACRGRVAVIVSAWRTCCRWATSGDEGRQRLIEREHVDVGRSQEPELRADGLPCNERTKGGGCEAPCPGDHRDLDERVGRGDVGIDSRARGGDEVGRRIRDTDGLPLRDERRDGPREHLGSRAEVGRAR